MQLWSMVSNAQQDAQFTQYPFNYLYTNPAYSGMEDQPRFTFIHRTQWLGYSTNVGDPAANPISQILSFNTPTPALRGGIGAYILNDMFGLSSSPLRNFQGQLSYAYHLPIGNGTLSIGARIGLIYQYIDASRWRTPTDPVETDKVLSAIYQNGNQSQLDAGLGLWYKLDNFHLGLSVNHLQRSGLKIGTPTSNNLVNHTYLNVGYKFNLSDNLNFRPTALVKTDFNSLSFEPTGILEYNDYKFWGGLSYRYQDAIMLLIGLSLLKDNTLRVGYAFDLTVTNVLGKAATSHEVMLSYVLPNPATLLKPVIKTPRFAF